ncbi:MAG: thioredoxin 1 [Euryarchaeota archaeon]|nr:thioredoxin 1 [Euryarchaeota archaeon]
MKKVVALLILLVAIVLLSGCIDNAQENSSNQQSNSSNQQNNSSNQQNNSSNQQNDQNDSTNPQTIESGSVVEVTRLKQINTYLQKNPVFLEIGSRGCSDCQDMKPILAQVAAEYKDRVTIMSLDMDENPKIADYFGAYVVPVSFMIIGIKNGNYTYMGENGNISTDGLKSRTIGPRDKEALEKILDNALIEKKKFK